MLEIRERIKFLRKNNSMTQEEFAKRINISRSNLGNIEAGHINVTDRVLLDICETFAVNETWLRAGEGEMEADKYQDEVLSRWVEKLVQDGCEHSFAKSFANMLAKLDEQDWDLLEKLTLKLLAERKKMQNP